jgi:hypothetical protein
MFPSPNDELRRSELRLWAGRTLGAFGSLFLVFDAAIKLVVIPPVAESFARLGFPIGLSRAIGLLELLCLVLYLFPATSAAGAVLLTGFLGGATAIHVRVGDPLFSHVLFPAYIGAIVWRGLLSRENASRSLAPSTASTVPAGT